MNVSLCFPGKEKSCFACCPPIRPLGYEHIQYKNIIKRILRENSRAFDNRDRSIIPITGFSCWALGFIRESYDLIGCLLHPAQNKGIDLRYRVNYGDKCRRESCQEEKIFSSLGEAERKFWLHLSDGLDSFAYSSREFNPLFRILGWGRPILSIIAEKEAKRSFTRERFFRSYPFFTTELMPKGNVYLLERFALEEGVHILTQEAFKEEFERFSVTISEGIRRKSVEMTEGVHTHLLDLDPAFSDFLRLSVGISKIPLEEAVKIKHMVDEALDRFQETIRHSWKKKS